MRRQHALHLPQGTTVPLARTTGCSQEKSFTTRKSMTNQKISVTNLTL